MHPPEILQGRAARPRCFGAVERKRGGAPGVDEARAEHRAPGGQYCEQGQGGQPAATPAEPGEAERGEACRGDQPGEPADGPREHDPGEVERRYDGPEEHARAPVARFAGGRGRRPRPGREPGRQYHVDQHVDAEVAGIAERAPEPRRADLRKSPVIRNFDVQGAGDDDARRRRAHREVRPEYHPPCTGGAEDRSQHHRECDPVDPVHQPLHAFVVRPQAVPGAHPEHRRQ